MDSPYNRNNTDRKEILQRPSVTSSRVKGNSENCIRFPKSWLCES